MVGFDPDDSKLTRQSIIYAGAISGALTRGFSQPLDVLKIRFQLQSESFSKRALNSKYHGILQATRSIYAEEGVRAFWKGHIPAQCLSITYGIVQFYIFEVLTQRSYEHLPEVMMHEAKVLTHFVCGGLAGVSATLAAQPFDVIRTRLVAQGKPKIYRSMVHAAFCMLAQEGPRTLYKGLAPTLLQIAPQTGFNFGFYSLCVSIWNLFVPNQSRIGSLESLICGSLSGLCSKVATYPLDVVKKRLQVQGFQHGRASFGRTPTYKNTLHCFRLIVWEEGLIGLYKGVSPSILKAMLSVGLHFLFYEQCCNVFRTLSDNL